MTKSLKKSKKKKILKHLSNVCLAAISFSLMTSPVFAVDTSEAASQVISAEGGKKVTKEVIDAALKIAKSKPAISTATIIVCLACVPAAGAATSTSICIACGILIAKTLG
jgi:hypothetical protein